MACARGKPLKELFALHAAGIAEEEGSDEDYDANDPYEEGDYLTDDSIDPDDMTYEASALSTRFSCTSPTEARTMALASVSSNATSACHQRTQEQRLTGSGQLKGWLLLEVLAWWSAQD